MSTPTINLLLRHPYKGLFTVTIRFFKDRKEQYIPTEFKTTREDWEAPAPKRGEGTPAYQKTQAIKQALGPKLQAAATQCGDELTFERFKAAYEGKRLDTGKTWITLLDRHLKLNQDGKDEHRYAHGTMELYATTRSVLVAVEQAGHDVDVENYTMVKHYEALERWMKRTPYTNKRGELVERIMGATTLSMHMQNLKAIANTGYDPEKEICWVPNDAYRRYKQPKRKVGTDPNNLSDFNKIYDFKLDQIPTPHSSTAKTMMYLQRQCYKRGRDFWCMMVICGGLEARTIASLRWSDVFSHEEEPHFRYVRAKTVKDSNEWILVSMEDDHVKYMFSEYGIKENRVSGGYVFPILSDGMSSAEKETAIHSFYSRITEYVGKIGKIVGTSRKPNCKRARPTAAVQAINNDMSIHEIKTFLGHAKISTTEIYVKNQATKDKVGISKKVSNLFRRQEPEPLAKAS